jgi:hypothetical protein
MKTKPLIPSIPRNEPFNAWLGVLLLAANSSLGVTFLSGPVFVPATNAPLAGVLQLTTDVETRISISVNDGTSSWTRNFHDFQQTHSVPLLGFKPGRTNLIAVTICDKLQTTSTATQPLTFVTAPLPADFPHSTVLRSDPSKMEPGFTLFLVQNRTAKVGFITIMDNSGEVVWYSRAATIGDYDVRQLGNGDLFLEEQPPLNRFLELNMMGEPVQTWSPPRGYPVNDHEGILTSHGTILYLSDVSQAVANFPSSATNANSPLITAKVDDNPVVEISASNGAVLNTWSPLALLDPTRVTYLTYALPTPFGVDNYHANAIFEDSNDNSIIVSVRDQHAVFKVMRDTGSLKWILGPHANWGARFQPYLLTPVGTPFQWNYGQHATKMTSQGTLLLYDDGNDRACPFDARMADNANYSRAAEFRIDETNMTVTQVWDTSEAVGDRLFTPAVGDADLLRQSGNVLVTYGLITYVNGVHPSAYAPNASAVRLREFTHETVPQMVFEISFFDANNTSATYGGYICYRSDRIPDLYAHPPLPVADLAVSMAAGGPRLSFSADSAWTYTVEAADDQWQWVSLGTAVPGPADTYQFQDTSAAGSAVRFYRVLTGPGGGPPSGFR